MKKSVVIFYEILSREYFAADRIKNFLKEKYNYSVRVFSILYEYNDALKFAKKNGIDCIVMPWLRLEENYQMIAPFAKINPKVIVCNFSHEQIASDETYITVIPTEENAKLKIIHFAWGDYFKDLLIKNEVPEKNIVITGNSRLDFKQKSKLSRDLVASKYDLDINKKWILFAESRDWVLDENNFYQRVKVGIDESVEQESFEWNKKYLKEIYRQLNELEDNFFEKYELIYRPHPSCSNPSEITNKNVKITADYSIYEWLLNVDYFISSASTSAFEAESIGLPVVCFELENMPKTFKTYGLEEYLQISNLNKIDDKLFKNAFKITRNKSIYKKYMGEDNGNNSERVADVINNLLIEDKKIIHDKINLNKKQLKIRIIKEKLKKFLISTGLIRLVKSKKWCKLAYKDCPYKKENKKMYGIK